MPIYMLGARLLELHRVVPLGINQAPGIALLSYSGRLYCGFDSDWGTLPDLHDLVETVRTELDALCKAAAETAALDRKF
jgi:hypothetical protein